MKKMTFLLIVSFFLGSTVLLAQEKIELTGKVIDKGSGVPLPGVTVYEKGTNNGTITDFDGEYEFEIAEGKIVVFTFVGKKTIEMPVPASGTIDVEMEPDAVGLDEVVVVGYGSLKKGNITGAITKIEGQAITSIPVATLDGALQGQGTGLHVMNQSASSGSEGKLLIRGVNSITSNVDPLIVVDGMPISNSAGGISIIDSELNDYQQSYLAALNPNDIASIQVLKDAAAAAIYGSRGANGVILITTKDGRQGDMIKFNYTAGVTTPINTLKLADADEWRRQVFKAMQNSGISEDSIPWVKNLLFDESQPYDIETLKSTNTNWYDKVVHNGSFQQFDISSSKAGENLAVFISGQYRKDEGNFSYDMMDKYVARFNVEYSPTSKLQTGIKLNISHIHKDLAPMGAGNGFNTTGTNRQNRGGSGGYGMLWSKALPVFPVYNPDGSYFDPYSGHNLEWASKKDNFYVFTDTYRGIGNLYLDYSIIEGLSVRSELLFDYRNQRLKSWMSDGIRMAEKDDFTKGSPAIRTNIYDQKNIGYNVYATYEKQLGEHEVVVVAGTESQQQTGYDESSFVANMQNQWQEVGEGGDQLYFVTEQSADVYFRSVFGRLNYAYSGKYLFGASYRRDGSNKFAPNNRWGNFPAASAGWIISNEDFASNLGPVSYLKLRGSYGTTGNSNIGDYRWANTYFQWAIYGNGNAAILENLGSKDLTWERSFTTDVSLEFGLLKDRISGSVGYYNTRVADMILEIEVPPSVGIFTWGSSGRSLANVGDMKNYGIEINLSSLNLDIAGFKWQTDLNYTTNKNEVIELYSSYEKPYQLGRTLDEGQQTVVWTGWQVGEYYMAEYAGLDDEGFELIYEIDSAKFADSDGEITQKTGNKIRATKENIANNKIYQHGKTGLPTYYGGIRNNFSFKGFELMALLTFQGGNYIYDANSYYTAYVGTGSNVLREGIDSDGHTLTYNSRSFDDEELGRITTKYLHRGDFIRFKTLQLGYNFPDAWTRKMKMKNLQIYARVNNLATFSKFDLYDPEIMRDDNLMPGVGHFNLAFMQVRTFSGGISITF